MNKRSELIFGTIELMISTIELVTSSSNAMDVGAALFGITRRGVLGLLYGHPDREYYLREIYRLTRVSFGGLQHELKTLVTAGLITKKRRGNQTFFQANQGCPVFSELHALVTKTVTFAGIIAQALLPLSQQVTVAFVFGSGAKQAFRPESDIDLLLVGSVKWDDVSRALAPTDDVLGREVNFHLYSPSEFSKKVRESSFLQRVLQEPKFFLVGSIDELRKLAPKQLVA